MFAAFQAGSCLDFLVVIRARLFEMYNEKGPIGYDNFSTGELELTFTCREQVLCRHFDLSNSRNAWASLPPLKSPPEAGAAEVG